MLALQHANRILDRAEWARANTMIARAGRRQFAHAGKEYLPLLEHVLLEVCADPSEDRSDSRQLRMPGPVNALQRFEVAWSSAPQIELYA